MTSGTVPVVSVGPQVRYARVSLGWFALNVSALAETATEQYRRWGRSLAWRNNFAAVRDGDPVLLQDRRLTPPWADGSRGEAMWSHYAWGRGNRRTSVRSAWVNVFPVRMTPPPRLVGPGPWGGVIHDLVYPHGVGCLIDLSFRVATPVPFADFCDAVAALRAAEHVFAGQNVPVGSFDDVADSRLASTSQTAFGGPPALGTSGWAVCTIVGGVPQGTPPVTDLRRASSALIHGLTDWRTARPSGVTGPVPAVVTSKTAQVFSGSSGRWIHGPGLLAGGGGLADFHRAMMWMSQQVDALGMFARYLADEDGPALPPSAYGLRRPVGMAIRRLRGGAGPVPAATVVQQLADRQFTGDVDKILRAEQLD